MRKKLLTLALTAAMVVGSTIGAMAETISGAWWTAWTPGYEVKDSVSLSIDVKGGAENWNNVSAVFVNGNTTGTAAPADEVGAGYKEYAVVRADSWGWGGGDNMSVDGNPIEYTTTLTDLDGDGDMWNDFKAIMADAHIDATISKTADGIELKYDVKGANGNAYTYTATTKVDTSEGLYVFFACDTSEVTVELAGEGGSSDEKAEPETTTKAPAKATTTAAADEAESGSNTTTVVIIVVAVVVVVCGVAIVLSKKKK